MANVTKKTGGGPVIEDITDTSSPIDNLSEAQLKQLLQKLMSRSLAKPAASTAADGASSSSSLSATTTATATSAPEEKVPTSVGFGEQEIRDILQMYVSVARGEDGVPQIFVGNLVLPKEFPSSIFSSTGSAGAFKDGPALVVGLQPGIHLKEENRFAALNHDPVKDATLAYSDGDKILFCEWDSRLLKSVTPSSVVSSSSSDVVLAVDPNAPSTALQKFIDDGRNLSRCIPGSTNVRARAGTTVANFVSEDKETVIVVKQPWTVLDAKQDTVDLVVMIYHGDIARIMHVRTPRYKLCSSD